MADIRKSVILYTDGACSKNPGPGGWAAILLYEAHELALTGAEAATTNNRMELQAVIAGLERLKEACDVAVYADSSYVINGFAKGWIFNWRRNGWINSQKKPVENKDLWQALWDAVQRHEVSWHWVKGHDDNVYNNQCDRLARQAIKDLLASEAEKNE